MSNLVVVLLIIVFVVALPTLLALLSLSSQRSFERRVLALQEASRGLAETLARELSVAATRHERGWSLQGTVDGTRIELSLAPGSVRLSAPLETAGRFLPWDLVHGTDFGPGGLYAAPSDSLRQLDPVELGPNWWVRGPNAEEQLRAISAGARAYLRDPPGTERPRVFDGELVVEATDVGPEHVTDWVRRVARAIAR